MEHYWHTIPYDGGLGLKISVVFGINTIDLTVFESSSAWHANITEVDLKKYSKKHHTDFSSYVSTLKRHLVLPSDNIELNFLKDVFKINLLLENDMKVVYFETAMKKTDFITNIFSIVDSFASSKKQYFEELASLKTQYGTLEEDNAQMNKKIDEFFERKKTDEKELFSKFVMLLNEKKREIQHLNDLLIAFKQGRPVTNPSVPVKVSQKGKNSKKNANNKKSLPKKNESMSDDSDSSKNNSEDSYKSEKEEFASAKRGKSLQTKWNLPSTSQAKFDFDMIDLPALPDRSRTNIDTDVNTSVLENNSKEKIENLNLQTQTEESDESPVIKYTSTQDLLDGL